MIADILTAIAPVLVAVVTIVPTVITNANKTRDSIKTANKAAEEKIEKVQKTLDAHIKEDEDEKARNQRYRILRFYDEMCEHRNHSESHFEDILADIDDYEKYCKAHPDFRNNRGTLAMEHIKKSYAKIKASGGFLIHEGSD